MCNKQLLLVVVILTKTDVISEMSYFATGHSGNILVNMIFYIRSIFIWAYSSSSQKINIIIRNCEET